MIDSQTNIKELGVGGKKIKYDAKKYIRHIFDEDIPHPNLWAMLFDAKIINDNNIQFVVGCIKNEDTEFFVKYMANINSVIVTNYKGYYYRVNPNSCMNTGIDVRSLTSIEAQARIANYLYDKQIVSDRDRILGASVQVYVFATAKDGNNKLYDIIHGNVESFIQFNIIKCTNIIIITDPECISITTPIYFLVIYLLNVFFIQFNTHSWIIF